MSSSIPLFFNFIRVEYSQNANEMYESKISISNGFVNLPIIPEVYALEVDLKSASFVLLFKTI
jgi:hypothetical protein